MQIQELLKEVFLFREVLLESQALLSKPSRTEDRGNRKASRQIESGTFISYPIEKQVLEST